MRGQRSEVRGQRGLILQIGNETHSSSSQRKHSTSHSRVVSKHWYRHQQFHPETGYATPISLKGKKREKKKVKKRKK